MLNLILLHLFRKSLVSSLLADYFNFPFKFAFKIRQQFSKHFFSKLNLCRVTLLMTVACVWPNDQPQEKDWMREMRRGEGDPDGNTKADKVRRDRIEPHSVSTAAWRGTAGWAQGPTCLKQHLSYTSAFLCLREREDNFWFVLNFTFALIEFASSGWASMSLLLSTVHFCCVHVSYHSSLKFLKLMYSQNESGLIHVLYQCSYFLLI